MKALLESTLTLQPAMVPSSVANSSVAGADLTPDEMTKSEVALLATPVAALAPEPLGLGIAIVCGATGWPAPSYEVALPEPLSEIQTPPLSPSAIPHGLARFGSVLS